MIVACFFLPKVLSDDHVERLHVSLVRTTIQANRILLCRIVACRNKTRTYGLVYKVSLLAWNVDGRKRKHSLGPVIAVYCEYPGAMLGMISEPIINHSLTLLSTSLPAAEGRRVSAQIKSTQNKGPGRQGHTYMKEWESQARRGLALTTLSNRRFILRDTNTRIPIGLVESFCSQEVLACISWT